MDEGDDVMWANHVDEGVAHIAFILEINRQVEEVIGPTEFLINGCQQHLLRVLIGDVLDHQRCTLVITYKAAYDKSIEKDPPEALSYLACKGVSKLL